jgi:predicted RND superfamily exporter protein
LKPPERLRVLGPRDLPALLRRRFEENDGRVGTVFYVRYRNDVSLSDGHNLIRIARSTDNVRLPDGTVVQTASRPTVFAEMIRSMERDGPRATMASLVAVSIVVLFATRNVRGALSVLAALVLGVTWLVGGAAWFGEKLNYVNFITLPITFGIGCEYPFNVYDRSRLLGGDVTAAVKRVGGAVAMCSFTTIVGYGSLLFADFQALQSFGRLAVSGEIACLSGAVLVLPALLHLFKRRSAFASAAVVEPPA